jgi:hypothetical protein
VGKYNNNNNKAIQICKVTNYIPIRTYSAAIASHSAGQLGIFTTFFPCKTLIIARRVRRKITDTVDLPHLYEKLSVA